MSNKEKHPNWFKMKIERRELIRQLAPETAVNVLLACWEYLETGEKPRDLSPIENIAFASFIPDMEEAWSRYLQCVEARASSRGKSTDIGRYRTTPTETEEEKEPEKEPETDSKKGCVAAEPPTRARFVPPTLDEVRAYCRERQNNVDPDRFVNHYQANGWKVGRNPMKDWKATVRTWEERPTEQAGCEAGKIAVADILKGFYTED